MVEWVILYPMSGIGYTHPDVTDLLERVHKTQSNIEIPGLDLTIYFCKFGHFYRGFSNGGEVIRRKKGDIVCVCVHGKNGFRFCLKPDCKSIHKLV